MDPMHTNKPIAHPECPTCVCDQPISLDAINQRIARLLADHPPDLSAIPADRLSAHPLYRAGFTGLKASAGNAYVGGQFLLAVHPGPRPAGVDGPDYWHSPAYLEWRDRSRYFAVNLRRLGNTSSARPIEYNPGDAFDISGLPTHEDIETIAAMSDEQLYAWLWSYRALLVRFAAEAIA